MEKLKKFIKSFVYLVGTLFLIIPIVLEYLSKTKMGVYRYVIAKNIKLEKLMQPQFILFLKVIFIIVSISSLLILIFKRENSSKITLVIICVLSTVAYIISITKSLNCYYLFLISICIYIILLYIQILVNKFILKIMFN